MKLHACIALICLAALCGGATPAKKPAPPKEDTTPRPYENAENKFCFKAPANWQNAGATCHGSLFNFFIPMHATSARSKDGNSTIFYGDIFTIAVNPPADPAAGLEAVVAHVQEEITKNRPTAKLAPVKQVKTAGQDASVVIATWPKKKGDDKPAGAERHTIFLKDGKVFEFIVYAPEASLAQSGRMADGVIKTFEWIDGEKPSASK